MRVACVVPWRGGDEHREAHHQVVRDHLTKVLPDACHLDVDSGHDPFSRAGSRNRGVTLASDAGADVVVLCDADTLPEPQPLLEAIEAAHDDGLLHLPYTWYRGLSPKGTRDYLAGGFPEECETELVHQWATGGVLVVRPDAWWRAGGMDERFRGYGMEDTAFRATADALLGSTVRHEGTIVHLWHPKSMGLGSEMHNANGALMKRYEAVEGDPAGIRALIAERSTAAVHS